MKVKVKKYDVAVVGGGHAGVEAALVSARMGCSTLLVTSQLKSLAIMPCNPSIGGLAKSHLVYEIDALGGEMGVNTDICGIQYRTLNASRGPAVRATRVQCDKKLYSERMLRVAQQQQNLDIVEDNCTGILLKDGRMQGIMCEREGGIDAAAVVLTTGTALRGRTFTGKHVEEGAGDGRPTSNRLSDSLEEHGFKLVRLKTGTPPRLHAGSIDWDQCTIQPGDKPPPLFSIRGKMFHVEQIKGGKGNGSTRGGDDMPNYLEGAGVKTAASDCSTWNTLPGLTPLVPSITPETTLSPANTNTSALSKMPCVSTDSHTRALAHSRTSSSFSHLKPSKEQIPCWLTHTNLETHRIIRDNLENSALYGGLISGTGVRYCPSIEDKIVKFRDAEQHHVFLEPEGYDTDWIYPNGLSNSLPRDVQERMVHSVAGLQNATFAAYGYAIEYDTIDARELSHALECKRIPCLYFAGQVNGTTGYEEAAAQGFMAGANAALKVQGRDPLVLSRQQAYIGVLIDDLVTKGTNEPYRMFTSRAERRLILRQDNARYRLLSAAEYLGVADPACLNESKAFESAVTDEIERLTATRANGVPLVKLLKRPGLLYGDLPGDKPSLHPDVAEQVEIRVKYEGYIAREKTAAARALKEEGVKIPAWIDYWSIPTLRYECREKLDAVKPDNLGQASRITGVTPADISILSLMIKRGRLPDS